MTPGLVGTWAVSFCIVLSAWLLLSRGCGLSFLHAALIALCFSPAPLARVIGGPNSYIYAFDLAAIPIAWHVANRWHAINQRSRTAAVLITMSAGVFPAAIALAFSAQYTDILLNLVSVYRLAGAMSLLLFMSLLRELNDRTLSRVLASFSLVPIGMVAAILLEHLGVLTMSVLNTTRYGAQYTFDVLGFFRGSAGLVASLGFAAAIAGPRTRSGLDALRIAGGISAIVIIVISGSKTSLLCILAMIVIRVVVAGHRRAAVVLLIGLPMAISVILAHTPEKYASREFTNLLSSRGKSTPTFDGRQQVWRESLSRTERYPALLFGWADADYLNTAGSISPYVPGLYHNEYVAVLMLGGVWSFALYVGGLVALGRMVTAIPIRQRQTGAFGILVLTSGALQALTVAHLQPGVLFVISTALYSCAYGIVAAENRCMNERRACRRALQGFMRAPAPFTRHLAAHPTAAHHEQAFQDSGV